MLMYIITIMLFRSGRTFAFTAMVLFSNGTKWSEAVVTCYRTQRQRSEAVACYYSLKSGIITNITIIFNVYLKNVYYCHYDGCNTEERKIGNDDANYDNTSVGISSSRRC